MLITVVDLCIIRLITNGMHHIRSRKPPTVVLVIPDLPHLAVIEKPYRFLTAHCFGFEDQSTTRKNA